MKNKSLCINGLNGVSLIGTNVDFYINIFIKSQYKTIFYTIEKRIKTMFFFNYLPFTSSFKNKT